MAKRSKTWNRWTLSLAVLVLFMVQPSRQGQVDFGADQKQRLCYGELFCYRLETARKSWGDARSHCASLGGSLAKPQSLAQNKAVLSVENVKDEVWVWLDGSKQNNAWTWWDQQTVVWTNWKQGKPVLQEPNYFNCLMMQPSTGDWQDSVCDVAHSYVCQYNCPDSFEKKGKNLCLRLVQERKTHQEASEACESLGGWLAEGATSVENDFITEIIYKYYKDNNKNLGQVWLGATDVAKEGEWVWQHSGTKVNMSMFDRPPSNSWGGEDCLATNRVGHWNDNHCQDRITYVCQQWAEPSKCSDLSGHSLACKAWSAQGPCGIPCVMEKCPKTCGICSGCPEDFTVLGNACYKYMSERLSWASARSACLDQGAILAEPRSREESVAISQYLGHLNVYDDLVWIGGSEVRQEGGLVWNSTGEPITRTAFGEPIGDGNGIIEECLLQYASYRADKLWEMGDCHRIDTSFICQLSKSGENLCFCIRKDISTNGTLPANGTLSVKTSTNNEMSQPIKDVAPRPPVPRFSVKHPGNQCSCIKPEWRVTLSCTLAKDTGDLVEYKFKRDGHIIYSGPESSVTMVNGKLQQTGSGVYSNVYTGVFTGIFSCHIQTKGHDSTATFNSELHKMVDCASSYSPCGNKNQTCELTEEGFRCVCHNGYQKNNDVVPVCVDIDECQMTPDLCMFDNVEHRCVNTEGSYRCDCMEGYVNWQNQYFCDKPIPPPKRPEEELPDDIRVQVPYRTLHWAEIIFVCIVIFFDLRMFILTICRWILTEPVPETDDEETETDGEETGKDTTLPVSRASKFSLSTRHDEDIIDPDVPHVWASKGPVVWTGNPLVHKALHLTPPHSDHFTEPSSGHLTPDHDSHLATTHTGHPMQSDSPNRPIHSPNTSTPSPSRSPSRKASGANSLQLSRKMLNSVTAGHLRGQLTPPSSSDISDPLFPASHSGDKSP